MDDDETVLDPATLARLQALQEQVPGVDVLGDLARVFREDAGKYVARIQVGLAGGEASTVKEAAHALKGAALAVGAATVADRAKALELAPAASEEVLAGLQAAVEAAVSALARARR